MRLSERWLAVVVVVIVVESLGSIREHKTRGSFEIEMVKCGRCGLRYGTVHSGRAR